jgi:hypothetical protein
MHERHHLHRQQRRGDADREVLRPLLAAPEADPLDEEDGRIEQRAEPERGEVARRRRVEDREDARRRGDGELLSVARGETLDPVARRVRHASVHQAERAESCQDEGGRLEELEAGDDLQPSPAWKIVFVGHALRDGDRSLRCAVAVRRDRRWRSTPARRRE